MPTAQELEERLQEMPFPSPEQQWLVDIASGDASTPEKRNELSTKLWKEITALPSEKRSQVISEMADKLNPKDPLSRVYPQLSQIPKGVSCISNADKQIVAATINGYEMVFHASPSKAPQSLAEGEKRIIEIAKQNTGDKMKHQLGPQNSTERTALYNTLRDELLSLTPAQRQELITDMAKRHRPEPTSKLAKIPLGVTYEFNPLARTISSATINGMYFKF